MKITLKEANLKCVGLNINSTLVSYIISDRNQRFNRISNYVWLKIAMNIPAIASLINYNDFN